MPARTPLHAMVLALVAMALAVPPHAAASRSVVKCGRGGTTTNGTRAVDVRARGLACEKARQVAVKVRVSGREGGKATTTVAGRRWRCMTTALAVGSDGTTPGPQSTHVECTSGSSLLVRFRLRS